MSPFDRSTMLERLGGDAELLDEVLELFVEECDAMVNGVRQAVQSRDSGDLRAAAHTLKGALLNIAAEPSADAARKLELMGRDEDLAGSKALSPTWSARSPSCAASFLPAPDLQRQNRRARFANLAV